jgi:hypothetical protein
MGEFLSFTISAVDITRIAWLLGMKLVDINFSLEN